jgi:DNA polymerase-1
MNTWIIDFEFRNPTGEQPRPWCVVGKCVETGQVVRLWLDGDNVDCPFARPFCMVAHYALAELACFTALGWQRPDEVVDTLPEARCVRGQVPLADGWGLLSVARWLGVPTMNVRFKEEMRALAMAEEVPLDRRDDLMNYCQQDVEVLAAVWERLNPQIDLGRAMLRGRYLKALAAVEARGIPADKDLIDRLQQNWTEIKHSVWAEAGCQYPGVITARDSFSANGWLAWCAGRGIHWPRLRNGAPCLDVDTFKTMADRHPEVRHMAYARKLHGQTRAFEPPLGMDDRLRCMMSPFGSDTGRNQPSNSRYIFGASAWLRSIIKAPAGRVLAYIDFSSQEFAVGAALSGDAAMMEDYRSGDPYLAWARRTGAVPPGATKASHPSERATFKIAALAIQYGMGDVSLAEQTGCSLPKARRLIAQHKEAYPAYWRWRQAVIDTVLCGGSISTEFGWTRKSRPRDKAASIANFPVQASGAEILRIAVIALEEAGHRVVATIHDAVLVEMDADTWQEDLPAIQGLMSKAALAVVPQIEIRTDVDLTMPGENYSHPRGIDIWKCISPVIGRDIGQGCTSLGG